MGFIIDTNVYVDALRDPQKANDLSRFYESFLPFTFLHASVAQELLAGTVNSQLAGDLLTKLIRPFETRRRLVVPSYGTWKRSGLIISRLVERRLLSPGQFSRSFPLDVLLAASFREFGHTLITENKTDFARIQKVERFEFIPPFPTS